MDRLVTREPVIEELDILFESLIITPDDSSTIRGFSKSLEILVARVDLPVDLPLCLPLLPGFLQD